MWPFYLKAVVFTFKNFSKYNVYTGGRDSMIHSTYLLVLYLILFVVTCKNMDNPVPDHEKVESNE